MKNKSIFQSAEHPDITGICAVRENRCSWRLGYLACARRLGPLVSFNSHAKTKYECKLLSNSLPFRAFRRFGGSVARNSTQLAPRPRCAAERGGRYDAVHHEIGEIHEKRITRFDAELRCNVTRTERSSAPWARTCTHHQYIGTNGALPCCDAGGCWHSRCQPVGDGDEKDSNLCESPVQIAPDLRIPRCMEMITPADVIRRIEMYYEGGSLKCNDARRRLSPD